LNHNGHEGKEAEEGKYFMEANPKVLEVVKNV